MKLIEDVFSEKYGKQCMDGLRWTLLPLDYEWSCLSCGCNVMKRKNEITEMRRKKYFINP